jgi:hypothetical protein
MIVLMASDKRMMGTMQIGTRLKWLGWLATAVMAFVAGGLLWTWN